MRPFFNVGYFPPENIVDTGEDSAGRIQVADDFLPFEYEAPFEDTLEIEVYAGGVSGDAIQIADDY